MQKKNEENCGTQKKLVVPSQLKTANNVLSGAVSTEHHNATRQKHRRRKYRRDLVNSTTVNHEDSKCKAMKPQVQNREVFRTDKMERGSKRDRENMISTSGRMQDGNNVIQTAGLRRYPLPFPKSISADDGPLFIPKDRFLKDEDPYRRSYEVALDTAYEGLAFDIPTDERGVACNGRKSSFVFKDYLPHRQIRSALNKMDEAGLFRTDVTQPFGLGTKPARTYVTRCLLGEEGTTYRYLGMRMFAHPWNGDGLPGELADAVRTIRSLNDALTERTKKHLRQLAKKRLGRGMSEPVVRGRSGFDVALINKMASTVTNLKKEPMFGSDRCSVSWHADSSLEHYSTIAVYHTIFNEDESENGELASNKSGCECGQGKNLISNDWSVALRVAHDSEGPESSRKGGSDDARVVSTTSPPVQIALPSGSTYYLLDDFNHHHQHAVLTPSGIAKKEIHCNHKGRRKGRGNTVRYSSTHRLLREGHNISDILARCKSACSNFHKRGAKIWRSEQLLLNEIETEWLRQFYIQGQDHKCNLWKWWKAPICSLLAYWGRLEGRTNHVVDILRLASEERVDVSCSKTVASACEVSQFVGMPSKQERKLRDKRRKALASVEGIMMRGVNYGGCNGSAETAYEALYEPLADILDERATMRELWQRREDDPVFDQMDGGYRPIPFPISYGQPAPSGTSTRMPQSLRTLRTSANRHEEGKNDWGWSPMKGGSPDFLRTLAKSVRTWGAAFRCKHAFESRENSVGGGAEVATPLTGSRCNPSSVPAPVNGRGFNKQKKNKNKKRKRADVSTLDQEGASNYKKGARLGYKKKRRF